MKFYYFPLYGRGEAIRMALWKAGVAYEDVRVSSEWGSLKQSGKFEFCSSLISDFFGLKVIYVTSFFNIAY